MMTAVNRMLARLRHRAGCNQGFTLIEILIALGLLVFILAGIYSVWFALQRSYVFAQDDFKAQEQARTAMAEMVELIRTARQPETVASESLRFVIVSADANSLVCWADEDRDANHDLELVRFWVEGPPSRTLFRDTSQTGDITFASETTSVRLVGDWVSNDADLPLFVYYDSAGTELPAPVENPLAIRTIKINLHVDVEVGKAPIAHELSSVVQPRNLRTY